MSEYIYLAVFAVALVWKVYDRLTFRKKMEDLDEKYVALYKEHNTTMIVLFLVLCINSLGKILESCS